MSKQNLLSASLVGALASCLAWQADIALAEPAAPTSAVGKAATHCFDFSNLNVGTQYHVGDVVNARHAQIEMKPYIVNGNPSGANANAKRVSVNSSSIAGSAPELNSYLLNMLVTPDAPLRMVTMKVAENWAGGQPGGAHNNLLVNGERHEIAESLASVNGKIIGDNASGKAVIVVNLDGLSGNGNWVPGTLALYAISGSIEEFGFGGRQVNYDDVCLTRS